MEPKTGRPPRILVIEDEPLVAMGLKLVLETMGCDVPAVVDNSAEAVDAAKRIQFDLILADVRLKGRDDGITAARNIRKLQDVPVLFVTGNADDLADCGLNNSAILPKPFLPSALERTVRKILETN